MTRHDKLFCEALNALDDAINKVGRLKTLRLSKGKEDIVDEAEDSVEAERSKLYDIS